MEFPAIESCGGLQLHDGWPSVIIRRDQVRAFENAGAVAFEDRVIARLAQHFPKHHAILGERNLRALIQLGWKAAEVHKFSSERNVTRYIELMCLLGSGFADDPQMPWAARMLREPTPVSEDARMDQLYDRAWDYIRHVAADYRDLVEGGASSRFVAAVSEIRHCPTTNLDSSGAKQLEADLTLRLEAIFPAKCKYIGRDCVAALIRRAVETAHRYGITSVRGVVLFAVLMFVVGSGFHADPQLPWASRVLTDKSISNQVTRSNQLFIESMGCLKQWWGIDVGSQVT